MYGNRELSLSELIKWLCWVRSAVFGLKNKGEPSRGTPQWGIASYLERKPRALPVNSFCCVLCSDNPFFVPLCSGSRSLEDRRFAEPLGTGHAIRYARRSARHQRGFSRSGERIQRNLPAGLAIPWAVLCRWAAGHKGVLSTPITLARLCCLLTRLVQWHGRGAMSRLVQPRRQGR